MMLGTLNSNPMLIVCQLPSKRGTAAPTRPMSGLPFARGSKQQAEPSQFGINAASVNIQLYGVQGGRQ